MRAEGQDLSLTKDKVLEQVFVHLPLKALPENRDKVPARRLRLAGGDSNRAVDLKDRKRGELDQKPSGGTGSGSGPRGKGRGGFGEPHRNNLGKKEGLPPGQSPQTVKDAPQTHVERLKEAHPGHFSLRQGGGTGKGNQGTAAKSGRSKGKRCPPGIVRKIQQREPILHIQGRMGGRISGRV